MRPTPFHAVYHLFAVNHWQAIVREQLGLLLPHASLATLRVTLATPPVPAMTSLSGRTVGFGADAFANRLHAIVAELKPDAGPELTVEVVDAGQFEHPAMLAVESLAKHGDDPVLYCHGKGVSYRPPQPQMERWRQHLNTLLRDAPSWVERLKTEAIDAVGPCLLDHAEYGVSFYAGNFWLARAGYLRNLPDYADFLRAPPAGWPPAQSRFLAEVAINRGGTMRGIAIDGRRYSMADIRENDGADDAAAHRQG